MISANLLEFYNSWTLKANSIEGETLSSLYDKYITNFIIYNNLYNQVPNALILKGVSVPDKIYDNKAATEFVVKYLGASNVSNLLTQNLEDINSIIDIINEGQFYIRLNHGERQRNEDLKILNHLRSSNEIIKANAILQVIYYVRCNLFHGHKNFNEYQRVLVSPLLNILSFLNALLFGELNSN